MNWFTEKILGWHDQETIDWMSRSESIKKAQRRKFWLATERYFMGITNSEQYAEECKWKGKDEPPPSS